MIAKLIRGASLGILFVALVAQAFRPDLTNPPVRSGRSIADDPAVPQDVLAILRHSCFDCHSNETSWPWYSHVTPMNFFLARHVTRGRRSVNFSEWASYTPVKRQSLGDAIYDEVNEGEMPLPSYLKVHTDARLTETQRKRILSWADSLQGGSGGQDAY